MYIQLVIRLPFYHLKRAGVLHLKHGDLDMTEKWLTKAAEMNPLDVFAFHFLGELYLKKDNIDKAAEFFDKAMHMSSIKYGFSWLLYLRTCSFEETSLCD